MAQPTLAEAAAEMRRSAFPDFCLNESARIARFAGRLADQGQTDRAREMFRISDMLGEMAHRQERAA
jgi:acyl carrier protein phosphodiesterase